jgi:hypothetical protein
VYTCYSPKDGKIADYHASLIQAHPCESDIEAVRSSVLDDLNTFIIEAIVNHELVEVKKTPVLNLLIKWHGYKEPTWNSLNSSLKKNEAVQEYLIAKGLQRFGFKSHKEDTERKHKRVTFSASVPDDSIP